MRKRILITLYEKILHPRSMDEDMYRKELVCNILLLFFISLLLILSLLSYTNFILENVNYKGIDPLIMALITSSLIYLLYISRKGYINIASHTIVLVLLFGAIYGQIKWGVDLPSIILLWSFVIIGSSILIGTRYSFILSIIIGIEMIILQQLESNAILIPSNIWRTYNIKIDDVIEYSVVFILIAGISWISNREIIKSIIKVKASKMELQMERDSLEEKVKMRTKELREIQIEKAKNMHQLIEFGRISSGLFHDLATPLNILSLSIIQIKKHADFKENISIIEKQIDNCVVTSHKITEFLRIAKKQIQTIDDKIKFNISNEIEDSIRLLNSKSRQKGIVIHNNVQKNIYTHGSPILFSHIMTNLISNAIDSYEKTSDSLTSKNENVQDFGNNMNKLILIYCKKKKAQIIIRVRDFGFGIPKEIQPRIFDTFFTTKSRLGGSGIGLSVIKHTLENHFNGIISFNSKIQGGTIFTIKIPSIKT
jgi:signal transduction histidine kinase